MRGLVEFLMRIWPINRLLMLVWRSFPFPKGVRSRIMRTANDRFLVGVIVMLFDDEDRIFLVRNTYDPRYAWSLPGGWMGRNEQPDECIRREIVEETGYEIEIDRLLATRSHHRLPSVDILYQGRIVGGTFRASAEISEAQFFRTNELPDGIMPAHKRMLEHVRSSLVSAGKVAS